jgi:hypothetical protein
VGTINSLGLEVGMEVDDQMAHRRLGWWDGQKISPNFIPLRKKPDPAGQQAAAVPVAVPEPVGRPRSDSLYVLGAAGLIVVLGGVAYWLVRQRGR